MRDGSGARRGSFWMASALTLSFSNCGEEKVALPDVRDPIFLRVEGIRLGMRESEIASLGRPLEMAPNGNLRERYGAGWITYGFGDAVANPRLSSVHWQLDYYGDSLAVRRRWEEMVLRLRDAYRADPACFSRSAIGFHEFRATWRGPPRTEASYRILSAGSRRGYRTELVILVMDGSITRTDRGLQVAACSLDGTDRS